MRRFFGLLFLAQIAAHSLQAQPKQLHDFKALMTALRSGASVRAVIYYAQCKLLADSEEVQAPDAIGGMELKTFEYFAPGSVHNAKGFLSTSETVLISHPRYGYVYNYVRMKVVDDGSVEIVARYLKPGTLEIVMDELFKCSISSGDDGNGVWLYQQ